MIDMWEAGDVARAFVGEEKVKLEWQAPRENRPKTEVKLVLNMMLLGIAGIPRGGKVSVGVDGGGFVVRAEGSGAHSGENRGSHLRRRRWPGTRCASGPTLLFEAARGERRTQIVDGTR